MFLGQLEFQDVGEQGHMDLKKRDFYSLFLWFLFIFL